MLDVAVVGAGMAGMACAARLRSHGLTRVKLFEAGSDYGQAWRDRYERLMLNSPFHDLPDDGGLRERWGVFFTRLELVEYLRAYAALHQLPDLTSFRDPVQQVGWHAGAFTLRTGSGEWRARRVVMATAICRVPKACAIPGREDFRGVGLHTARYVNAQPFREKHALVIGSGNSAFDVSLDLVEGGAASVTLWVRGARYILDRKAFGRAASIARRLGVAFTPESLAAGHRYGRTHPDWRHHVSVQDDFLERYSVDLQSHGIRRPDLGPATENFLHCREPTYDSGTGREIQHGRIEVIDGNLDPIERLTRAGVAFPSGERTFDAVLFGTGFEPGLEQILHDAERLLYDDAARGRRMPATDGRCRSVIMPELWFPGFDPTPYGGMSLGLWGAEAADEIARELGFSAT